MGSVEDPSGSQALQTFSDYEKVYLNMSRAFAHLGKEHWAIHCVCGIRCDRWNDDAEMATAVEQAWKGLLYEYPGLSVKPEGSTKVFEPLSEQVVEQWADQTFSVGTGLSADDVVQRSGPGKLPSLVFLPESSELVFLSQHWRNDALGVCMMLNRLLELLARDGNEPTKPRLEERASLSPSMEDAAGSDQVADSKLQQYARQYIDSFHQKAVNSGGLPVGEDVAKLPGATAHREIVFGIDSTRAIVTACKMAGISVTAAIHVALAKTVLSLSTDEQRALGYTTVMAVNMRDHLPSPYNTAAHACQTYVASITPTVQDDRDFISSAHDLTQEYRSWYSEDFRRSLRCIYQYHAAKLFASRPADAKPPKPPSGVTLSSLGVVKRCLKTEHGGGLSLDTFRFGVSMFTRQTLLYAWTFRGQLCFSLDYNSAYYDEGMVEKILGMVKWNLDDGLAIGPTAAPICPT